MTSEHLVHQSSFWLTNSVDMSRWPHNRMLCKILQKQRQKQNKQKSIELHLYSRFNLYRRVHRQPATTSYIMHNNERLDDFNERLKHSASLIETMPSYLNRRRSHSEWFGLLQCEYIWEARRPKSVQLLFFFSITFDLSCGQYSTGTHSHTHTLTWDNLSQSESARARTYPIHYIRYVHPI